MPRVKKPKLTDMQKFIKLFGYDQYKTLKGGKSIEFRVKDLDMQKHLAQLIIEANGFRLKIVSDGLMATYRAFEVQEVEL